MDPAKPIQIVTLLTDFGNKDAYAGVLKGVILQKNPGATVIDLSHAVEPQAIQQAAWILAHAFSYFPKASTHLAIVDPGVGSSRKILAAKAGDHFFVAPDNGILTAVWNQTPPQQMVSVTNAAFFLKPVSNTFHGRDIMAPVAAALSLGVDLETLGPPLQDPVQLALPPLLSELSGTLEGCILYADHFGNLVTNIIPDANRHRFIIEIQGQVIHKVVKSYTEVPVGSLLAIIGSSGKLEIAVHAGNARETLQAESGQLFNLQCEDASN